MFWLEQALAEEDGRSCAPLTGTVRGDVCIVGGGYTGLWTALEVLAQAPDASVVLIDAQACGFGASGRNGGWVTSWYDELGDLVERFGPEQGVWLADRSSEGIDRLEATSVEEGIDCHLRRAGGLIASTAPAQDEAWAPMLAEVGRHGREGAFETLEGEQLRQRTGSPILRGGVRMTDAAAVQPALLARGLRRLALRRGVRIFEGTPMIGLDRGRPAAVMTPAGRVEAGQVVLTTGAWAAEMRELRRAVVPVGSHIVLTEAIPERLIGTEFSRGELLSDTRLLVHYIQVTRDGRIAFGRGGGAIGGLGRVRAAHHVDPDTVAVVARDFRRWFPDLADVALTHAWGGAVDRAPGHLPFVGTLGDHGSVHYGVGFSGNGVGPSVLVGRILGRLALGMDDEYTHCGLVSGPPGYLPPEPLRSLGGVLVRDAVRRAEAAEEEGADTGAVTDALRRLVWFTLPPVLEPRQWRARARARR